MYNETGKKYDFQRQYNHSHFWDAVDMKAAKPPPPPEPEPKKVEPVVNDSPFYKFFGQLRINSSSRKPDDQKSPMFGIGAANLEKI